MFLYQPTQQTTVRKRTQGSTNSARTDEVFENLSSAAIPANPKALERVKSLLLDLANGRNSARDEIAKEVISDPGLGLYYLSNLRSILNVSTLPEDPLLPIYSMPEIQIKELFDVSASHISKHRMSEAGPPQLLRLQHTFIASNCATNLSRQLSIEEGKVFSLVSVSQSALNLLAWNYPSQFHKALFNKRRYRSSIDDTLSALVGIRPENIVNKLARKVGLPTSLLLDLQMSQRAGDLDFSKLPAEPSVLSLARMGDLLARANDSEHYPEALSQWKKVEEQLEERGLDNPKDELHNSIKSFISDLGAQSALPYHAALFPTQVHKTTEPDSTKNKLSQLNPYLNKLPEQLRPLFDKIYLNLLEGTVSILALQIFIEELAPAIGVYSGCLYLAKGKDLALHPSLHFGTTKKNRQVLNLSSNNPVSQSIFSKMPQQFESGSGILSICGALPDCQKQAVLLMEFNTDDFSALGEKSFIVFNAITSLLVDIIGQRRVS